ncbi:MULTISPECIES: RNA polymerase sigma factor [Labrys]|uniref:RNA polymerase sigma factor n=1 Tax=Labrys TaxID=204476 RepID=UPI00083510F8|nr:MULTISPECIES: RNA polymerase sigma factor [unclassified Labrys (in: a-proteobacteria)]MDZ5450004.1 RNA polymerase sigma factor [Labrys sp. ZIDIC5]OCC01218.1 RNA polymerase subunit sigma-24 [Labrys sp. WJW]
MPQSGDQDVRTGLAAHLVALWRFGLVLSGSGQSAEELVQATCLRALERSHQFMPGTRLDRWLFAIERSIWLNEIRANKIRNPVELEQAESVLSFDGERQFETNILAAQVLRQVQAMPAALRETVFLVYAEGLSYAEAADMLAVPIGTIMSRLASARLRLAHLNKDTPEGAAGESS